jgi:transposase
MLSEKQMQCINLMVIENKTQKQIAKELKITEQTICNWKKDKEFKNEIENNIKENFGSLAVEAQKELKKLLKSNNEYIKMQAVKDILDRAGYKPVERREIKDDTEKTKKIDAISDILNQMQSADDV